MKVEGLQKKGSRSSKEGLMPKGRCWFFAFGRVVELLDGFKKQTE